MISIIKKLIALGWGAIYRIISELFLQWFKLEMKALISLVWMVLLGLMIIIASKCV